MSQVVNSEASMERGIGESSDSGHEKSNLADSLSNFSIQYNLGSATLAVEIMRSHRDSKSGHLSPDFPEPVWAEHTLLGMVYVGTIVGMVVMGYLGDAMSKRKALIVTLSLTLVGSLGGALLSVGSTNTVYAILCAFRFILGFGVGGIYPLSATHAAETAGSRIEIVRIKRVAKAFIWQVPGAIAPYIVGFLLMLPGQLDPSLIGENTTAWQFRCMLGFGSVPAAAVLYLTIMEEVDHNARLGQVQKTSLYRELVDNKQHWKTLFGTSATWFFYDVGVYGTFTFTPMILDSIFGEGETLLDDSWHSIVISAFGIPGVVLTIYLLDCFDLRQLNILGFTTMLLIFSSMAFLYAIDADHVLLFAVFCLIAFATNVGVSVATYVLPAVSFPPSVTSSFHGISAASAKIGAATGTFLYPALKDLGGVTLVMIIQAMVALLGLLVSYCCLKPTEESQLDLSVPLLSESHEAEENQTLASGEHSPQ